MPIEDLIIKVNAKIDLIAGINLLFDSKYQISSIKVKNILEKLKTKYDIIIIDTSSEMMKLCQINIFILEANLLEIKKAQRLLNIYINEWQIPQKNFKMIFNKYNKNAIDDSILKHIFSDFLILGKLSSNSQYDQIINKNAIGLFHPKMQKEYRKIQEKILEKMGKNGKRK